MSAEQKVDRGDTVEVLWEDTFTLNGWQAPESVERSFGPCIVRSVGVLVMGDADYLGIAASVGPNIWGEVTRIPMSSIISAVRLLCEEAHQPIEGMPEQFHDGIPVSSKVIPPRPKKRRG